VALTPGTRLGVYEITALIGEGGMGQVFRARDSKLGRDVAIKILPDPLAADPERLARFEREAKTLASLNHPHIAAIYGVEDSADVSALVMELVEGEDLSQRIARSAIPLDEALPIAKQIAEALEAAHEQGIIHRDLKPANIKVRADGMVKVLDFGLAKAMEPVGAFGTNAAMSPTLSVHATMAGVILGTAAYMSPEQARGKALDKRADIWAFGTVLFEMLTGRRAFPGEDISDTIVSVVSKEPDWSALPTQTPLAIRHVLARCLKKDAKARMRDIGEARLEIEDALTSPADGAAEQTTSKAERRTTNDEPRRAWRRGLPWVVTAAALAAATISRWALWPAQTAADRPRMRLDVDLGAEVSLPAPGIAGSNVAISPDGTRLVYASGNPSKLYTRRLDQSKATELPATEGAQGPFFSPDGQWIGFAVGRSETYGPDTRVSVKKISVEGGAVVTVSEELANFVGASWADDGSIILGGGPGSRGLLRIPAGGGASETVAPLGTGEAALARPQGLPGGKAVLFTAASNTESGDTGRYTVEVLTLADHHRKIVARGGSTARYLPASTGLGHLVYTNHATLFAVPFDLQTLETRGTVIPVLDDVGYFVALGVGGLDVTRTGTLIYRRATGGAAGMTTVQWLDAGGKKEPVRATPAAFSNPRLSPDGKRIALGISAGANQDIWVYEPQRDASTRLTFGGVNAYPVWSPDGQYVVFTRLGQGIFQVRADGASQPQALTGSNANQIPWSFTPGGKRLACFELGKDQMWTVALDEQGGQLRAGTPEPFLKSAFSDQAPSFSPDGRWLAYHSNESGRNEVFVRAFPLPASGQGGKWQISYSGGAFPRWSRTGHALVYQSGDQLMTVSYTANDTTFEADKPRVWIASLSGAAGSDWDLAADGKRIVAVIPEGAAQAPPEHEIVMLLNFADELRRRVPVGK
jgi:serine/threonine-protein kinase